MNSGTAQQYARWIGGLYLVSLVAGGWGESHVPNTLLLANDLAGTAHQMASSVGIFRSSFAAYLVEATCDITLNVLLYALLRPVSRNLALLAMCFGLMGMAIFAAAEMLYFAAALPAVDADVARVISPEAKATLTYICLTIYGYGFGIFAMFYGIAAAVRGYLILRSGYLPRTLGAILILGGASFIADNLLTVLAPQYHLPYIIAPMERTNRIICEAKDALDMRRRLGAAAVAMDGTSDLSVQTRWRATVAVRLPQPEWPQHTLLIPAVDADTGEPAIFNRHSGVDLVEAVAASCAGGFAYTIGDKRYIDGAYRADVNADLAAGYRSVLVIPPLGDRTRKPLDWGLHLAAQVDDLRKRGSRVEIALPDSDSQHALGMGMNMMDLSRRGPAAQAGYNQGKVLAEQLTEFWN